MADTEHSASSVEQDSVNDGREQLKRAADDDLEETLTKRRKIDELDAEVTVRVLVQSRDAGGIIGKYNAVVSVPESHSSERVLTITSRMSNALKIFHEIIPKFGDYRDRPTDSDNYQTEVKLLIQQTQIGGIIGRAGFKIKELRQETNAGIKIFSDALPRSTERVVAITGTPNTIVNAIGAIFNILLESPPKGHTELYEPSMRVSDTRHRSGSNYRDFDQSHFSSRRDSNLPPRGNRGGSDWRYDSDYDRQYDYPRDRGRDYDRDTRGGPVPPRGRPQSMWDGESRYMSKRELPISRYAALPSSPGHIRRYPRDDRNYEREYNPRDRPMYGREYDDVPRQPSIDYRHEPVAHNSREPAPRQAYGSDTHRQGGSNRAFTMQVSIPKDLAGSIIGKGGTRIREVREKSGAMIKIDDAKPGQTFRIITISGSKTQTDEAHYLLQDCVRQYSGKQF